MQNCVLRYSIRVKMRLTTTRTSKSRTRQERAPVSEHGQYLQWKDRLECDTLRDFGSQTSRLITHQKGTATMNSGELLAEGLSLMFMGMGTVFVFLAILVVVTSLMSSLIQKHAPDKPAAPNKPGPTRPVNDQILLAVISAAIHKHRSR